MPIDTKRIDWNTICQDPQSLNNYLQQSQKNLANTTTFHDDLQTIFDLQMIRVILHVDRILNHYLTHLQQPDLENLTIFKNEINYIIDHWPINLSLPIEILNVNGNLDQIITRMQKAAWIVKTLAHDMGKTMIDQMFLSMPTSQFANQFYRMVLQHHNDNLNIVEFKFDWLKTRRYQKLIFKRLIKYWFHHSPLQPHDQALLTLMQNLYLNNELYPYLKPRIKTKWLQIKYQQKIKNYFQKYHNHKSNHHNHQKKGR